MSKLKLKLNDSDLTAIQAQLLLTIRANPMDYLRQNPTDYLIVAELTTIYNKVELKVRDLEWFGSTRSTSGKIVTLTLTRSEALALFIMLTQDTEPQTDTTEDESILPFERINVTTEILTYEVDLMRKLVDVIQRAYFI